MSHSAKTRDKISEGLKLNWKRPARKKQASAKMKEVWSRPGMRDRWIKSARKAHRHPEVRKRHGDAVRKMCRRPEVKLQRSLCQEKWQKKVKRQLKAQGYKIFQHGWPDFICIRKHKVLFVEAKSPTGKLSSTQQKTHSILRKIGLEVKVIHAE